MEPTHEPDAVRVDELSQENARLDSALRLSEEHIQRLSRENNKLQSKVEMQHREIADLLERIRCKEQTDAL